MATEFTGKYSQGTGRRKTSTARVRLYPGDGRIVVNDKPLEEYFPRERDRRIVLRPLEATGRENSFTVSVHVMGGGNTGQAGAVAHGLARALVDADEEHHAALRQGGYLSRDPREKERKKPGLKRARKAPQYTKR